MTADLTKVNATTLEDKYRITEGPAFMTGIQALVRLALEQRRRDRQAGHDTAGFISGYQGSPLAVIDGALRSAAPELAQENIVFMPGVNEELAATAVAGTQYVGMFPGAKVDGVFGIWYGKGPGVDRSVDALRHANWAGTSALGGTLALAGDDHGAKSSTVACYSDIVFESAGIPLFYPSDVQDILEFGLHGIAMSRYAGLWAGMKLVTDVVESAAVVQLGPQHPIIARPTDARFTSDALAIRPYEMALIPVEERLYHRRLYAALAYVRANAVNRITHAAPDARIGIISAGKAYQDVRKSLQQLGSDGGGADGIRVLKLGMVWPVEPEIVRRFAEGLDTVIVVEEKRPLVEAQVRSILYGSAHAPRVIGKVREGHVYDDQPAWAFPNFGEVNAAMVTRVVRALRPAVVEPASASLPVACPAGHAVGALAVPRTPSFCSGCPHNRSTKLPDGSRVLAGIGCHGMQIFLDPDNCKSVAQMGGEGIHWLGQQPFTRETHVFANLGDGTYAHSGSLAIRQAVAAGVPITYKLLVNGFVSMTGGQDIIGKQSIPRIIDALRADGVERIVVVTDDTARYAGQALAANVPVHPRTDLDLVQKTLRAYPGVSVLVYDQVCATERRRLRKQKRWEDPAKRSFINTAVCEGCGDCGKVSNCLSIEPVETPLGRKRRINQSSCNKDFSCVEGFCPSFVTVHGGGLRKPASGRQKLQPFEVPQPTLPTLERAFNLLIGGIGGTGVVTIGQVLGMAAHIDGTPCLSLDVMGMAQKYGAVYSHLHFASDPDQLTTPRIDSAEVDTLIGCDLIVASGNEPVAMLAPGRSRAVVCTDLVATSAFAKNPDWNADADGLVERIRAVTGEQTTLVEGQRLALALLGDAIASNMLMAGVSWQLGQIPISLAAIQRAITLNGVSIEMNLQAFQWGRCFAHDRQRVLAAAAGGQVIQFHPRRAEPSLDETVADHVARLRDYQDAAYAQRYQQLVQQARGVDAALAQQLAFARAVAHAYYKLLAVKDEWEVARLHSSAAFREEIAKTFEGDFSLRFHIGGWPFAKRHPGTGQPMKREVGSWLLPVFGAMARLRGLRGSLLDPFRYSAERRFEQALIARFEEDMAHLIAGLRPDNYATAVAIAKLPMGIRGYGHVKQAAAAKAEAERQRLLAVFHQPAAPAALRKVG